EFKETVSDFNQLLQTSGVKYSGSFEDAISAFNLPAGVTEEQTHFLLTNRAIQKQLTRQPNFNTAKAAENIAAFLNTVQTIQLEKLEEITDLECYQFIACFGELKWSAFTLPKNCLILDFFYENEENLGQDIPVAWNIQTITKGLQKPVNGMLPLRTNQVRVYMLSETTDNNGDIARDIIQTKADARSIIIGNVMDINEMANLFKFAEDQSQCLIVKPPSEWTDIIISAVAKGINECGKINVLSQNLTEGARFEEKLSKFITASWQQKLETATTPAKKRKRASNSVLPSPNPPPPPSPSPSQARSQLNSPTTLTAT
uniref:Uncharacterized protein n=1 Tax=Panagrolaimus sp. ES5 TaxID=591445 RepID=A0AC34FXB3_9BILA